MASLDLLQLEAKREFPYVLYREWVKTHGEDKGAPIEMLHKNREIGAFLLGVAVAWLLVLVGVSVFLLKPGEFGWLMTIGLIMVIVSGIFSSVLSSGRDKTGFTEDLEDFRRITNGHFVDIVDMGLKELWELAEKVLSVQAARVTETKEARNRYEPGSFVYGLLAGTLDECRHEFIRGQRLLHERFGLLENANSKQFFPEEESAVVDGRESPPSVDDKDDDSDPISALMPSPT